MSVTHSFNPLPGQVRLSVAFNYKYEFLTSICTHNSFLTYFKYDGDQLLADLVREPSGEFDNFCRMSSGDFELLLQMIAPTISKENTTFREAIPAKIRLAVTLRYLATGDTFKSLNFLFKISPQVISTIVPQVCRAICVALKNYIKVSTFVFLRFFWEKKKSLFWERFLFVYFLYTFVFLNTYV